METIKKFTFGKIDGYHNGRKTCLLELQVTLKYNKDNKPVFSASGRVWNNTQTDIIQGGQCIDTVWAEYYKQIKNAPLYVHIMELWKRNHLNDLNAGVASQMEAIEKWKSAGNSYEYGAACEHLRSIGLYEVDGYKYGHGWIYRDIPEADLKAIKLLLEID